MAASPVDKGSLAISDSPVPGETTKQSTPETIPPDLYERYPLGQPTHPMTDAEQIASKLRAYKEWVINPPFPMEYHRENLLFLIDHYENGGSLPPFGQTRWVQQGKLLDHKPTEPTTAATLGDSVCCHNSMVRSPLTLLNVEPTTFRSISWASRQRRDLDRTCPDGAVNVVSIYSRYTDAPSVYAFLFHVCSSSNFKKIPARIRLPTFPNTTTAISIANDTGSNVQTIHVADLFSLPYHPDTTSTELVQLHTPVGRALRFMLDIEIQITKLDGVALTDWFPERAIIGPPGSRRLSGDAMRNHLYFATAPGNTTLYISANKHGLTSQLPVVQTR